MQDNAGLQVHQHQQEQPVTMANNDILTQLQTSLDQARYFALQSQLRKREN